MSRKKKAEKQERVPLFYLLTAKYNSSDFPGTMCGKFFESEDGYFFAADSDDGWDAARLQYWKSWSEEADSRYAPLIGFLAKESMPVRISGRHIRGNGTYAVESIDYHAERGPLEELFSPKPSPGFLSAIVSRLENSRVQNAVPSDCGGTVFLSKPEEIEAYYKVCRHVLPAWNAEAIRRELRKSKNGGTSDNRKHAQTALQYLVNIDWSPKELHAPSVRESRAMLDEMFFGLESVKARILEIVAQINRTGELPLWGILLNGPAGTGKTSIAKAIARLLNEPVISIDVSSIGTDPEALSGSSRIYGNGRPGIVLDKMLSARSSTGVLLINEIDKATAQGREGRAGSADVLLTLLDRQGFFDNFLEDSIPTDGLFAVATCNEIDKLSAPLRDRFLVINIPGYSAEEKEIIWRDYVLPRVMKRLKLAPEQIRFTPEAVSELIRSYAVEPGVRDLEQYSERFAATLCTMLDQKGDDYCHVFTREEVIRLLGPGKRITRSFAVNPGEINAVFYCQGSAHFFLLEAAVTNGTGKFQVFGPVPELQKEYIQVAYECIRSTTPFDLSKKDVAIFVPHAIPAGTDNHIGCAAYAAICSLIMRTRLEIQDIAFVGGVDLNGNLYFDDSDIRPLLKALREAGIKTVYAPVGVSDMISKCSDADDSITVIEAQNAQLLVSMAMTASRI